MQPGRAVLALVLAVGTVLAAAEPAGAHGVAGIQPSNFATRVLGVVPATPGIHVQSDDLTQDTYLRAIPALRRFRADAPARTWLLAIARRACAAEIGARSRDRRLVGRIAAEPDRALGQPPAEPGAEAAVGELLAALQSERRAAFVLTQLLGCSYAEAAAVCGCPVGTIRSRVARAREDLNAMTADPGTRPEPRAGQH